MNTIARKQVLNPALLNQMDCYWRAANYLSVGQIYLYDNPLLLLREPLKLSHVKPLVGNAYMEGSYSEVYPNISEDEAGLRKLFKQFSFPGGISSHVSPEIPGSNHEGGEPDVVMASCGGTPTLEVMAAVSNLRMNLPELKIRNWKWGDTSEPKDAG